MKNRGRLLNALAESCWAIQPEMYAYMLDFLSGKTGAEKLVSAFNFEEQEETKESRIKLVKGTNIAYIPMMGTVYPRKTSMLCGGLTLDSLKEDVTKALENKSVTGILLDGDGPGGSATGVNEFSTWLFNKRDVKPIYSYVGGTAASATYWLVSSAERLIIDDTARLGSVGVVVGMPKKQGSDDYVEITNSLSPYKRPDVENKEHLAKVVEYLDSMADVFYLSLARNFGVSVEDVKQNFGQGGMKVGKVAVASKMAYSLGSFESTVEMLQQEIETRKLVKPKTKTNSGVDNSEIVTVKMESSEAKKGGNMDLNELMVNHPDLVRQIRESAISEEKGTVDSSVAALKKENETLSSEVSSMREQLKKMERETLQNRVALAKTQASAISTKIIGASSVPEKFHEKVMKQINFQQFVDSEGAFDEKGFTDSFSAEVAEWEASFGDFQGFSGVVPFSNKEDHKPSTDLSDEILASINVGV